MLSVAHPERMRGSARLASSPLDTQGTPFVTVCVRVGMRAMSLMQRREGGDLLGTCLFQERWQGDPEAR
jgi:hypothetical protein